MNPARSPRGVNPLLVPARADGFAGFKWTARAGGPQTPLRYRVSVCAEATSEGDNRRATVYVSGADIFIPTSEPLELGSEVYLTIHTPGEGFICADGQVVWTNLVQTETIPAGMGVQLTHIAPEDRVRLESVLEAL